MTEMKQARRIQESLLNGMERRALVWMAGRMPRWVSSDMMSALGIVASVVIAAGYILSDTDIRWLWLSSAGLVLHWFGDSMDGTLARVRDCQRPVYGFYLDHTLDVVTEMIMFVGIGLSSLVRLDLSLAFFVLYLAMTLNVTLNSYLKSEFRLTYFRLGPTEFRLIIIVVNTLLIYCRPLREFRAAATFLGSDYLLTGLDVIACVLIVLLLFIYIYNVVRDARGYARIDPPRDKR